MAQMNLAVTIPASGKIQLSAALPTRSGGAGNLLASGPAAPFSDNGDIFMQNVTFQNQGTHSMYLGDSTTTDTTGGGLLLSASGSFTATAFINYGTYLSDWWVAGTPGDVLMVLFIR